MKHPRLLLLLIPILVACANPADRAKLLPVALEEFNSALVWKNYAVARHFLVRDKASKEVSFLRRRGEKLRLVEVEPLETRFSTDGKSAYVLVRFSWYGEADLTVKKGAELQEWKKLEGFWRMVGRTPPEDDSLELSPFVERDEEAPPEPP